MKLMKNKQFILWDYRLKPCLDGTSFPSGQVHVCFTEIIIIFIFLMPSESVFFHSGVLWEIKSCWSY